MADIHQQAALNNIARLMNDPKYSDFTIKCGGKSWHVHKAILCSASAVIARACESKMLEDSTNTIEHNEFDADTMERMVSYIYKQTYELQHEETSKKKPDCEKDAAADTGISAGGDMNKVLIAHSDVYGIAEFYEVLPLKQLATERFKEVAASGMVVENFIDVVKAVSKRTSQTDTMLRTALRDHAILHSAEIAKDERFMSELAELEDVQDFAVDMVREMVRQRALDKEDFQQRLDSKDVEIAACSARIRELETHESRLNARLDAIAMVAEQRQVHMDEVLASLVDAVAELPDTCRNPRCEREFGGLTLERKGHSHYGANGGNYVVRCGRCRCKLSS